MAQAYKNYVGVFDSGVGGISILKSLTRVLPNERFLYFGDSANAPYGEKDIDTVRALSTGIVEEMIAGGVKAIVIACNTATAAAAAYLRARIDLPIIGVEPALKPAAIAADRVLVMATDVTLSLKKYHDLWDRYAGYADCISLPCPGLAARIEHGALDAPDLRAMLADLLAPYIGKVDAVVLGCTHYPFVKKPIADILGDVRFFDSGDGTARELRRVLAARGTLAAGDAPGGVIFQSSIDTPEEIALYKWFYHQDI